MTILGTGTSQGVPVIGCHCEVCTSPNPKDNRFRVASFIQNGEDNVLIDAGPDLRMQLLRADISNVDAVLLTHEHNDHVAGIDDLRPINFLHKKSIPIYAEARVCNILKTSFEYIFDTTYDYPGKPKLTLNPIGEEPFIIGLTKVIPIRAMHGDLPILGFRVGKVCYLTDVKTIAEKEIAKLQNLDVLVINALHHSVHMTHLNVRESLELVKRIKSKKTYLTHISHRMGLHDVMNQKLPAGVRLAFDGLVVESV